MEALRNLNLQVDKKCDLLISAMESLDEHLNIRLSVFADHIVARLMGHIEATAAAAAVAVVPPPPPLLLTDSAATADMSPDQSPDAEHGTVGEHNDPQSASVMITGSAFAGGSIAAQAASFSASTSESGPPLTRADLATLRETLERMQIDPTSLSYAAKAPLGVGGFSKASHILLQ